MKERIAMKLISAETVAHPSTNSFFEWGQVRRFLWETGEADQPYLAVAVSTVVNAFDGDNILDNRDATETSVYAWCAYRTTSFYTTLEGAQQTVPSVYDITSLMSGDYSTRDEAKASAASYLNGLRAEDFKPETIN